MFCRSCGSSVPADSRFCPQCGVLVSPAQQTPAAPPAALPKQRASGGKPLRVGCVAVVGFLILVWIIGAVSDSTTAPASNPGQNSSPQTTAEDPPVPIRARTLVKEYEANEIAADRIYKGKKLFVTGTVGDIRKDILDTPYVTLDEQEFGFRSVQAYFDKSAQQELASLQKGETVGVICVCDGLLMNVLMKKCSLVRNTGPGE